MPIGGVQITTPSDGSLAVARANLEGHAFTHCMRWNQVMVAMFWTPLIQQWGAFTIVVKQWSSCSCVKSAQCMLCVIVVCLYIIITVYNSAVYVIYWRLCKTSLDTPIICSHTIDFATYSTLN